jgi:hypothetical protein
MLQRQMPWSAAAASSTKHAMRKPGLLHGLQQRWLLHMQLLCWP